MDVDQLMQLPAQLERFLQSFDNFFEGGVRIGSRINGFRVSSLRACQDDDRAAAPELAPKARSARSRGLHGFLHATGASRRSNAM